MYGLFPPASTSSARFVNSLSVNLARRPALARRAPSCRLAGPLAARPLRLDCLRGPGFAGGLRPPRLLSGRRLLARGCCHRRGCLALAEETVDCGRDLLDGRHAIGRAQQAMVTVI